MSGLVSCLLLACATFPANERSINVRIEPDSSPVELNHIFEARRVDSTGSDQVGRSLGKGTQATSQDAPGDRLAHEAVLGRLGTQATIRQARQLLEAGRFADAVVKLEQGLDAANGCDAYLSTLESAYRAYLAELIRTHRKEEARIFSERLRCLCGDACAETAESCTRTAEENGAASRTRVAEDVRTSGRSRSSEKEASAPERESKPGYVARAKLDDKSATDAGALANAESLVTKADACYRDQRYRDALAWYEQSYSLDPSGPVQTARNRYGYCLLAVAYAEFQSLRERGVGERDRQRIEELTKDIALARQLVSQPSYRDFAQRLERHLTSLGDIQAATSEGPEDALLRESQAESTLEPVSARIPVAQAPKRSQPQVAIRHLDGMVRNFQVIETQNFRIYHRDRSLGEEVAHLSERYRMVAYEKWFPGEPVEDWQPKCEIFLYPTATEYTNATGVPAMSPGHTKTINENGLVRSRVIELRVDDANMKGAVLPHEMVHAVVAGRFGSHRLPRWADEGLAVLTEPDDKANAHLSGLLQSRSAGRSYSCAQIMTMQEYPGGGEMGVFYAHSVGICHYLVELGGEERMIRFLRRSLETSNYVVALREIYGVQDFSQLEQGFHQHLAGLGQGLSGRVASAAR